MFSWRYKHCNKEWDSQAGVVEAFKGVLESVWDEHKIALEKSFAMDDVWLKASKMQDDHIHHKTTMSQ